MTQVKDGISARYSLIYRNGYWLSALLILSRNLSCHIYMPYKKMFSLIYTYTFLCLSFKIDLEKGKGGFDVECRSRPNIL